MLFVEPPWLHMICESSKEPTLFSWGLGRYLGLVSMEKNYKSYKCIGEEPWSHLINVASQVWITSPMWNEEQGGKVEMG